MAFKTIDDIKQQDFVGFATVASLFVNSSVLPKVKGVYIVLYVSEEIPNYLEKNK